MTTSRRSAHFSYSSVVVRDLADILAWTDVTTGRVRMQYRHCLVDCFHRRSSATNSYPWTASHGHFCRQARLETSTSTNTIANHCNGSPEAGRHLSIMMPRNGVISGRELVLSQPAAPTSVGQQKFHVLIPSRLQTCCWTRFLRSLPASPNNGRTRGPTKSCTGSTSSCCQVLQRAARPFLSNQHARMLNYCGFVSCETDQKIDTLEGGC